MQGSQVKRTDYGVTIINSKLFVIGGSTSRRSATEMNETFDIRTKKWEVKCPLKIPRQYVFKYLLLILLLVRLILNKYFCF